MVSFTSTIGNENLEGQRSSSSSGSFPTGFAPIINTNTRSNDIPFAMITHHTATPTRHRRLRLRTRCDCSGSSSSRSTTTTATAEEEDDGSSHELFHESSSSSAYYSSAYLSRKRPNRSRGHGMMSSSCSLSQSSLLVIIMMMMATILMTPDTTVHAFPTRTTGSINSNSIPTFPRLPSAFRSTTAVPTTPTPTISSSSSSSTMSSALLYMSLHEVSDLYASYPVQSAIITCGFKASIADSIAQFKDRKSSNGATGEDDEEEDNDKPVAGTSSHDMTTTMASSQEVAPSSFMTKSDDSTVSSSSSSSLSHESTQEESAVALTMISEDIIEDDIAKDAHWWEARRNTAYVIYGGLFVGLMCHMEYNVLFPYMFGTENTLVTFISKVLFDNFVSAPLMWLPPAYLIKAVLYDYSLQEGLEKYVKDIREEDLLLKYWKIWVPAQTVSFSVVPDHLRVAFMAAISFFWFILFSSVSSSGSDTTDESKSNSHGISSDAKPSIVVSTTSMGLQHLTGAEETTTTVEPTEDNAHMKRRTSHPALPSFEELHNMYFQDIGVLLEADELNRRVTKMQ